MTTNQLAGRVAIVTGGASSDGFRIALRLVVDGASVALLDADGAGENAEGLGDGVLGVRVDTGDEQDMCGAVSRVVDHFGRLDIVVNRAGAAAPRSRGFWRSSRREDVLTADLRGMLLGTRIAVPYLHTSEHPAIVNVGAVAAARGYVGETPYCAEHMAVIGMTLKEAEDHGGAGVRVNAVMPVEGHPDVGRAGAPRELAAAVAYLCGDEARSVKGSVVPVDTGFTGA